MTFYSIDPTTETLLRERNAVGQFQVTIDWERTGDFQIIPADDILEASFTSEKQDNGGIVASGKLLLNNNQGTYSPDDYRRDGQAPVLVACAADASSPLFSRFKLFIHPDGLRETDGPGKQKQVCIDLVDLSDRLNRVSCAGLTGDPSLIWWKEISIEGEYGLDDSVLGDLCSRAGLGFNDIQCQLIMYELPFVRLSGTIWEEICTLARAYRAHLEAPNETGILFIDSPYRYGAPPYTPIMPDYTFHRAEAFQLTSMLDEDYYRNVVRLDYDMPVSTDEASVWKYNDPPMELNDENEEMYPFTLAKTRAIQLDGYEAPLAFRHWEYGKLPIVKIWLTEPIANALDNVHIGGTVTFPVLALDTERKTLSIKVAVSNDLEIHSIEFTAAVLAYKQNAGLELRDEAAIASYGEHTLHVRNQYLTPHALNGTAQYIDWVQKELASRTRRRRIFDYRTNHLIFHARVGAYATLDDITVKVRSLKLLFKQGAMPEARLLLEEA